MAPQSPERDRRLTWFYYTQGSEAFKGDLYFYSVDHDLRDRLGEIDGDRCPVVMLTGDYDYLTTPEDGRRTASKIKGAEFIEMKDIGHFPMSENCPLFQAVPRAGASEDRGPPRGTRGLTVSRGGVVGAGRVRRATGR
jgi:pimeloyl-ACP methyl ester carboxylesterase